MSKDNLNNNSLDFCSFCNELKFQKEVEEEHRENRRRNIDNLQTEYKVALIVEHYDCPDDPAWLTGSLTGTHQQLNFCPVCGKSLKGDTKNE